MSDRNNKRLRAARVLAGFRSARAAALAHSWPESLYAAHESGSRHPSAEQLKIYLDTFGVDVAKLDDVVEFGSLTAAKHDYKSRETRDREISGRRLGLARRVAAYRTALDAAAAYGWKEQTYYAHESGRHAMSEPVANAYGIAFGVSPAWLLKGHRPSGLSDEVEVDDIAERFVTGGDTELPAQLSLLVSPTRRGARQEVDALRKGNRPPKALAKATNAHGDTLDVVREGSDDHAGMAWGFPEGFLSRVWGITATSLRMVPLTPSPERPDVSLGDRVLIDCNSVSGEGVFAVLMSNGDISAARDAGRSGEATVLGRVLARISRAVVN